MKILRYILAIISFPFMWLYFYLRLIIWEDLIINWFYYIVRSFSISNIIVSLLMCILFHILWIISLVLDVFKGLFLAILFAVSVSKLIISGNLTRKENNDDLV